jgi:hypothetical protein
MQIDSEISAITDVSLLSLVGQCSSGETQEVKTVRCKPHAAANGEQFLQKMNYICEAERDLQARCIFSPKTQYLNPAAEPLT